MLFAILDAAINFYSGINSFVNKSYVSLKTKAFEHELLYYAVYDTNTKRYTLIYDYDKPLCVFWCLLFGTWMMETISYQDIDNILHNDNLVVVCSYILYGEQRHCVYDYQAYKAPRKSNNIKVIYAYSDTNQDLTHEFERFKSTVFEVYERLGAQNIYNMLVSYKKKSPEKIDYIKAMTDYDFNDRKLV